tara:strand:+ start:563 stop:736 length:174 start_codon:yes stop_codon:yes gene_type:complete
VNVIFKAIAFVLETLLGNIVDSVNQTTLGLDVNFIVMLLTHLRQENSGVMEEVFAQF